jgi:hypothetical protein
MPLPSMRLSGAKQCTALTKRTKQPCKNPAAYGCKTCRMHGARKPETIKQGKDHANFVHGRRTREAEKQHSEFCRKLEQLEDAMHLLGMTSAKRSRGRKARGYAKLTSLADVKSLIT